MTPPTTQGGRPAFTSRQAYPRARRLPCKARKVRAVRRLCIHPGEAARLACGFALIRRSRPGSRRRTGSLCIRPISSVPLLLGSRSLSTSRRLAPGDCLGDKGRVRVGRLRFASDDRFRVDALAARGLRVILIERQRDRCGSEAVTGARTSQRPGPHPTLHCRRCHASHRRG